MSNFLTPHNVQPFSRYSIYGKLLIGNNDSISDSTSTAYPSANLAIYIPFYVEAPFYVKLAYWLNGAIGNNVDAGVYDATGVRLFSTGSTAQVNDLATQQVSISNVLLTPGLFFLAVAMDGTTGGLYATTTGSVAFIKTTGIYQQASAFPLPATATFALPTFDYVPLVGISPRSSL